MASYTLSRAAKNDLKEIAKYGDQRYGEEQSDDYRRKLKNQFAVLAEQPMLFQAVDHIQTGYRRCVCELHSIYYRINDDGVEIMRIIRSQAM